MEFKHITGSPLSANVDLLCLCVSGTPGRDPAFKAANTALGGVLTSMAKEERFTGKVGQCLVAATYGDIPAARVALLGAGDKADQGVAGLRDLAARAAKLARAKGAAKVGFVTPAVSDKEAAPAIQNAVEGAIMGAYRFDRYRKNSKNGNGADDAPNAKSFQIATDIDGKRKASAAVKAAIKRGTSIGEGVCRARDYINEPAAEMTPSELATIAKAIARKYPTVKVKILNRSECEKLGMGMFLAVAKGSDLEPKFIHLTYTPKRKAKKKIALIGKGITFDSGGYSLKPSAGMEDMKIDMSGAAAVIGSMGAIAELECPHEVHVIAACCENLVSGRAYKLGDVLTAMDGSTVEINNTDAEGRLTLGDAITYVREKIKPDEMFDFATLTGACMVALGPHTAGVMSNNDDLIDRWLSAADAAGEEMWQLPLNPRLREQLKSPIAQLRNTGERWGGAITAGLFLGHFAGDTPWVHVDLAGPASSSRERGATPRGGTGFAVATICAYLSH